MTVLAAGGYEGIASVHPGFIVAWNGSGTASVVRFLSQRPVIPVNEFNQVRFTNAGIARSGNDGARPEA